MFVLIEENQEQAKHLYFQHLKYHQNKTTVCKQQFLPKSAVWKWQFCTTVQFPHQGNSFGQDYLAAFSALLDLTKKQQKAKGGHTGPPLQQHRHVEPCVRHLYIVAQEARNRLTWKWARIAPCPFVVIRSEILLYKYHWQHLLLATHTARTAPALRVTYCCKCYRSSRFI